MKKINVIVKEKTILELKEDALKGDIIDLKDIVEVDSDYIASAIDEGKDKVYLSRLQKEREIFESEKKSIIIKAEARISELEASSKKVLDDVKNANLIKIKENDLAHQNKYNELQKRYEILESQLGAKIKENELSLDNKYKEEIMRLSSKISELEASNKKALDDANNANMIRIKENDLAHQNEYNELQKKYEILLSQLDSKIKENELLLDKKYQEIINNLNAEKKELMIKNQLDIEKALNSANENKNKEIEELKSKHQDEKLKLEDIINTYQRQKANLNVKQTGEDLEVWCDNEVNAYMQNGLFNCIWEKDNKVIKNEDDTSGSKADFIFSIYASAEHLEDELLARVCLEMKDENPDSVNKKKNSDHYKKLDDNRNKKNCKYAVLVSNLELDKPNILPIYKVREYENMYVVRPAYLMTLLNMITSLSQRFASLILQRKKEDILFKDKESLLLEFDSIKNTYLDKPLDSLSKQIAAILASSKGIKDAATKIDDACEKINSSYIRQIEDKIARFELKINKISKKID